MPSYYDEQDVPSYFTDHLAACRQLADAMALDGPSAERAAARFDKLVMELVALRESPDIPEPANTGGVPVDQLASEMVAAIP